MTPDDLIEALSAAHSEVPTALLRAATEQRQALTEPLLSALTDWVETASDPTSTWDDERGSLAACAMYLLAQFREPRAFRLYLRLCRLPEERNEYWLGDILNEDVPAFLASTCAGDLEALKALLLDPKVYEWSRWAAVNALTIVAVQGDTSSADLADWLVQAGSKQPRDPYNLFWTFIASIQYDLAQASLMPTVRQAFADGLVDPLVVGLPDLERQLQLDPLPQRQQSARTNDYLRDAATAMAWLIEAQNRPRDEDEYLFSEPLPETYVRGELKIGRNDPCPCGSGKKFKKCCLNADPFADSFVDVHS